MVNNRQNICSSSVNLMLLVLIRTTLGFPLIQRILNFDKKIVAKQIFFPFFTETFVANISQMFFQWEVIFVFNFWSNISHSCNVYIILRLFLVGISLELSINDCFESSLLTNYHKNSVQNFIQDMRRNTGIDDSHSTCLLS